MLAQNFLTPAELWIDDDEFDAALKVLNMLERGELVHLPKGSADPRHKTVRGFRMSGWTDRNKDECGTYGCIGGWMEVVLGRTLKGSTYQAFYDLFFPSGYERSEAFTTERAAIAMRAKLTTGKADWRG